MNESTFQRCPHDRENPYVMISREMAQDKSISPKAKGVLLYLLSLPKDWKIYHSQLQHGLAVGEEYINSAMNELIANGYAERTREKVKGIFQPYRYLIREVKKCLPDGKNQAGFSGPENPVIQKKEDIHTKETATKEKQDAVVFSESKIFDCLKAVDIQEDDKIEITKRYNEDAVKYAIAWATHPQTKLNKGLAPAIKWACRVQPQLPKDKVDEIEENKSYAKGLDGMKHGSCTVNFLHKCIEIDYGTPHKIPFTLDYSAKDFKEQLNIALKKAGF